MRPQLIAYCAPWQLSNSPAFHTLLVEALQPYADIQLVAWDRVLPLDPPKETEAPIMFCQIPPPPQFLTKSQLKIIWIPMWDECRFYPAEWWQTLPKSLRIVSFAHPVTERAKMLGLTTLALQYFPDPAHFVRVEWSGRRVLLYWNRTGLFSEIFLRQMCDALHIDLLLFRSDIDPQVHSHANYHLPAQLGNTQVQEFSRISSRAEYLALLQQANVFLSPRSEEGVGMTFLEAMASGAAVFALNGATMNEYLQHRQNGYLLRRMMPVWSPLRIMNGIRRRLASRGLMQPTDPRHYLAGLQNWGEVGTLNLQKMGNMAYQSSKDGFQRWQHTIKDYADFVLDW